MKNKLPKAKCEKCMNCKLITPYDVIICDFLNGYQDLYTTAYIKPKFCSNFKKNKKNITVRFLHNS